MYLAIPLPPVSALLSLIHKSSLLAWFRSIKPTRSPVCLLYIRSCLIRTSSWTILTYCFAPRVIQAFSLSFIHELFQFIPTGSALLGLAGPDHFARLFTQCKYLFHIDSQLGWAARCLSCCRHFVFSEGALVSSFDGHGYRVMLSCLSILRTEKKHA